MNDKLIVAVLFFAVIGFIAVIARLMKMFKMMSKAKEEYEVALEHFKNYEEAVMERYGIIDDIGNKVKDTMMSVFDKVVKPFKDLYEYIRKQMYEIVPFLVFQLTFLGFLIYWSIIPPHKNPIKQTITLVLIVVLLTGVIGISYGFWYAFKYGPEESFGGYLLRKELDFLKAIKNMSVDVFYALIGKKKEGFSLESFDSCFT